MFHFNVFFSSPLMASIFPLTAAPSGTPRMAAHTITAARSVSSLLGAASPTYLIVNRAHGVIRGHDDAPHGRVAIPRRDGQLGPVVRGGLAGFDVFARVDTGQR